MARVTQNIKRCTSQLHRNRHLFSVVAVLTIELLRIYPAFAQGAQTLAETRAYDAPEFAGGAIRDVVCDLLDLLGGKFGGLLLTASGIVALGYAAFGDAKMSTSLIVVAVGCFAMSSMISLYFGDLGCPAGNGGGAANGRVINDAVAERNVILRALGGSNENATPLPLGEPEGGNTGDPFTDF